MLAGGPARPGGWGKACRGTSRRLLRGVSDLGDSESAGPTFVMLVGGSLGHHDIVYIRFQMPGFVRSVLETKRFIHFLIEKPITIAFSFTSYLFSFERTRQYREIILQTLQAVVVVVVMVVVVVVVVGVLVGMVLVV